jgi:hypothetical protein
LACTCQSQTFQECGSPHDTWHLSMHPRICSFFLFAVGDFAFARNGGRSCQAGCYRLLVREYKHRAYGRRGVASAVIGPSVRLFAWLIGEIDSHESPAVTLTGIEHQRHRVPRTCETAITFPSFPNSGLFIPRETQPGAYSEF